MKKISMSGEKSLDEARVIRLRELRARRDKYKKILTPEEYHVLREKGTEPAFSGEYWNTYEKGTYQCRACGLELFSSEAKFDSGTGWPSFYSPVSDKNIKLKPEASHGLGRTEVLCPRCGSHLGHVFDDGPKTLPDGRRATGKRFCINSKALKLEPENFTQ